MSEELQAGMGSLGRGTLRQVLEDGAASLCRTGIESGRLDAELILAKVLNCSRERLYNDYEMGLEAREQKLIQTFLQRRARREPLAYILGRREFWSLDFYVSPDVLVPRPETERLVEVALEYLQKFRNSHFEIRILDLGTGSGAIAVSLARERTDVEAWATDISPAALKIACTNAARHGVADRLRFLEGDLFGPVRDQKAFFDMIVCNPPYIRRDEMPDLPPEVRDWEPRSALDGGLDGLDFYRRIVRDGHLYLAPGGSIAFEIGADMGSEVRDLLAATGRYSEGALYQDYSGRDRVVVARKL